MGTLHIFSGMNSPYYQPFLLNASLLRAGERGGSGSGSASKIVFAEMSRPPPRRTVLSRSTDSVKEMPPAPGEEEVGEITDEQHSQNLNRELIHFWMTQNKEMGELEIGTEQDFKNHNDLPLARIKRIMKSDEDVRMISAEAPVLFAKACEIFILELTLRSWCFSEKSKRRTLQKDDIEAAIQDTPIFDFLVGLQP